MLFVPRFSRDTRSIAKYLHMSIPYLHLDLSWSSLRSFLSQFER